MNVRSLCESKLVLPCGEWNCRKKAKVSGGTSWCNTSVLGMQVLNAHALEP